MDKVIAVVIYLMPFISFILAIILAKLIIAYKTMQKRYINETQTHKNELSYQNKLEDTNIIQTNNIIDIETITEPSKSKTLESLYKRVGG